MRPLSHSAPCEAAAAGVVGSSPSSLGGRCCWSCSQRSRRRLGAAWPAAPLLAAALLLAAAARAAAVPPLPRQPVAPSPAPGAPPPPPYDLDAIHDLPTLLWRHQNYQTEALLSSAKDWSKHRPPAVVVGSNDLVGLGNRVPAMVTGYLMALLTGRLFLLHSTFLDFVDLPFPGRWQDHMNRYRGARDCVAHWMQLPKPELQFCNNAPPGQHFDLVRYGSIDYDTPLLQINPSLERYFAKFFPDGEVFHHVARHLLRPRPNVEAAMAPYVDLARDCLVGMHIRTRKYAGIRVKQFTAIARTLAQAREGSVFVASDADLFPYVQADLPGRRVWWSNHTQHALQSATRTRGHNPGTELSAVLDVMLLSKCAHIILTPASSLGTLAAGLAGVTPVFANFGRHEDPFLNPWFWKSLTTEPCMFKASGMHFGNDTIAARFRDHHPLYLYHNQCHYQAHLRRVPRYLKQSTANATYLTSLINDGRRR